MRNSQNTRNYLKASGMRRSSRRQFVSGLALGLLSGFTLPVFGQATFPTPPAVNPAGPNPPGANPAGVDPAVPPPAAPETAVPTFEQVKALVKQHFASIDGYEPGDLITNRELAPLFPKLTKLGWTVYDQKTIVKMALDDSDPLSRALRTEKGTRFMRKLSGLPEVYDRMDRLRRMPYGMRRIHEMVEGPDGYKLFEYMVTTPGGENLGKQLSRAKNGAGFNQPTGRLYTENAVLERLATSYKIQFKIPPETTKTTRRPTK